ncbi:MAG: hypothetical protein Q9195_006541 [Heterodermia aff. obscurata]
MGSTAMVNSSLADPFTQTITLHLADGTPLDLPLSELDEFMLYNVQICINFASQIGASFILLVVLLLLTKPDKRRAPIFVTNVLSLALNVIRNILQCLYFTGPFNKIYAYYGQDYSHVAGKDYGISVTASVLTVLLLACVESSLLLQIRVVCCTLPSRYRLATYGVSILTALLAIAFRFALCVENSKFIVTLTYETSLELLDNAANITTSISICWFCAAFVTKLGFALHQRRKLGLDQFRPMQIIFIMACQTLVIPAIFSILPYFVKTPGMSSQVLTLVSIFLPLSSLWASASIGNRSSQATITTTTSEGMKLRQKLLFSGSSMGSSLSNGKGPLSPASTARSGTSNATLAQHAYPDIGGRGDVEAQALHAEHKV